MENNVDDAFLMEEIERDKIQAEADEMEGEIDEDDEMVENE